MRAQADRKGAPLINRAEPFLGEHIYCHGARVEMFGDHLVRYLMAREVQGGYLNGPAIKPMNHNEQSLVGHGGYIDLRTGGNSVAATDRQNIAQPRHEFSFFSCR